MNKLLLLTTALLIPDLVNAAETSCSAAPTCAELGYNEIADDCRGKYIKCPFDTTKVSCVTESPRIGDLKYSLYNSSHDGWLKCDGTVLKIDDFRRLYNVIGTKFCHRYTSRTDTSYTSYSTTENCSADEFALPDYRGFFLRGLITYNSTSSTVGSSSSYYSDALKYKGYASTASAFMYPWLPQYEQLPNITGEFGMLAGGTEVGWNNAVSTTNNAFYRKDGIGDNGNQSNTQAGGVGFQASRSNTIYDGSHVMPASYGAYIYIYAGQ